MFDGGIPSAGERVEISRALWVGGWGRGDKMMRKFVDVANCVAVRVVWREGRGRLNGEKNKGESFGRRGGAKILNLARRAAVCGGFRAIGELLPRTGD